MVEANVKGGFDMVIFGDSSFAEIANLYFGRLPNVRVLAHVVDQGYKSRDFLFSTPVLEGRESLVKFDPATTRFFVAVTYARMNTVREEIFQQWKAMGFTPASYVGHGGYVDDTSVIGPHCFIFENNTIQPFVEIGSNVILWSGNHIGHHSKIDNNCFVSSHVVVSGHCSIGRNSFLGVNSTVANNISLGEYSWIAPTTLMTSDTRVGEFWRPPQRPVRSERRMFPLDS